MNNLLEILSSVDYEDNGSLHLTEIREIGGDLALLFDVIADEHPDLPRNIEVTGVLTRENTLSAGYVHEFEISQDHVLLWHYTKPYALVSFYGKALDALSVVGALYARHVDLVEDWIPFHKYMNSEVLLAELIAGSFGMLAEGPEPLVLAYAEVMQSYGFTTSHHSSVLPGDWVGESADLSVLILDKSNVIASAFLANALD